MKRIALVFFAALLIVCLSAGALGADIALCSGLYGYEYVYGYVHVFWETDIRSEPNDYSGVVGIAWRSEELDFLGDVYTDRFGRDWYRVVVNDNNNVGWICEEDGMLFEY